MKTLGVIGGLGPWATAYFMQLLVDMTKAEQDQQHIPSIVISRPQIPDRTDYIVGRSKDNPLPEIIHSGQQLAQLGADYIAIPCITAHYFHEELTAHIPVPVINIVERTVRQVKEAQIRVVGLLATDGTIQSGIFQKEFKKVGIRVILPREKEQKTVMELIYNEIKAGQSPRAKKVTAAFLEVSRQLSADGAELQILGCTELSLLKREQIIGAGYLDVMEVLAQEAVKCCGNLKESYEQLI